MMQVHQKYGRHMERTRIIKAALALKTFTIGELAAHAAANANTVRSYVTSRDVELYERVGDEKKAARGRPRSRYRLRDPDGAIALLRDDQQRRTPDDTDLILRAAQPLVLPVVPDAADGGAVPIADTLEWARSRLSLAMERTDTPDESRAYAEVARDTAREVIAATAHEPEQRWDARLIEAFALILCGGEEESRITLHDAATQVADLVGRASTAVAGPFLQALTTLAQRYGQGPPIGVVAHGNAEPTGVLVALGGDRWECEHLSETGDKVWWPGWASSLYDCQALAGIVVDQTNEGTDEQHFEVTIQTVKSWRRPTVVCNFEAGSSWGGRALTFGAAALPTFDAAAAVSYIGHSLDDLVVGAEPTLYADVGSPGTGFFGHGAMPHRSPQASHVRASVITGLGADLMFRKE